ncbi:MAG: Na+/H+ antiporter subunit B [Phycisphaerae bacterium]|nr:Na+/H+ antiporter subunit B [Phycisphaerae bacterium]NUQ45539.1 Na+/H+ antiporter subunit B [Phycisphaerae bacterium]
MTSVILTTTARLLHPVLLITSIFLLLRGHNEPGGGFSGGLVAASAFALHAMAHDARQARRALRIDPHVLIGVGLLTALSAGVMSLAAGAPLLTGLWTSVHMPGLGEWAIGTPLLFDVGVYLVVVGITLLIILCLSEAE